MSSPSRRNRKATYQGRTGTAWKESGGVLRAVVDNLPEGLVIASMDGQILSWNSASRSMLGFNPSDELRWRLSELSSVFEVSTLDGRGLELEAWPLSRVIAGESVRDLEVRVRRVGNDRELILRFWGDVITDDTNNPFAFVSFSDITGRNWGVEAVRLQNTMPGHGVRETIAEQPAAKRREDATKHQRSPFLADMSHELRTPLNAIIGLTQLIYDDAVTPDMPQYKDFLNDILTSAKHLLRLIDDALEVGLSHPDE